MTHAAMKIQVYIILVTWTLLITSTHGCMYNEYGEEEKKTPYVLAINLGMRRTSVGVYSSKHVEIIPNELGNRITPSYVAFTPDGERLIGDAAKNQLTTNPENTVFDVKRLIGRTWNDPSVQEIIKDYPFKIVNKNSKPHIQVNVDSQQRLFAPEEISAIVLSKMKDIAETYLEQKVVDVVITVPAYFNNAQRRATKDAGTIAGLNVLRLIIEPLASVYAHYLDDTDERHETNVLVFTIGDVVFDATIINMDSGVFEVLSTIHASRIGGQAFDNRLMKYLSETTGRDLWKHKGAMYKTSLATETARRELYTQDEPTVLMASPDQGYSFIGTLTRATLEDVNSDLFLSTLDAVRNALLGANLQKDDIKDIILAGGSVNIHKVHQLLKEFFHGKVLKYNTMMSVANGATRIGHSLTQRQEVISLCGAAPFTMGFETYDGVMYKMFKGNSLITRERSELFNIKPDKVYNKVSIKVYVGERYMAKDNIFLGMFYLTIIHASRAHPTIRVTFKVDDQENLIVTAEDLRTRIKNYMTIKSFESRFSPEDIENMMLEGEAFAEEDKKTQEFTERKRLESENVFEQDVQNKEEILKDINEKITWVENHL